MGNFSIEELIKNKKSQPRYLKELNEVLAAPLDELDRIIYDVYREVALADNLRYDLTFLYPEMLDKELPKTYGHYHKNNMMEIMEVISGTVYWLIQRYGKNPKIIKDCYLIQAKENEKAVFPAGFGAISINPQINKKTILSNWVSTKPISDYVPYTKLHGACYYILKDKDGKILFEKNPNYKEVPKLIKLRPKELPEFGITFDKPLRDFSLKQLEFLNNPKKYKNIFTIEKCYAREPSW